MSFTSKTEADFTVGRFGIVSAIFFSNPVVSVTRFVFTVIGLVFLWSGVKWKESTDTYRYLRRREKVERQLRGKRSVKRSSKIRRCVNARTEPIVLEMNLSCSPVQRSFCRTIFKITLRKFDRKAI